MILTVKDKTTSQLAARSLQYNLALSLHERTQIFCDLTPIGLMTVNAHNI